MSGVPATGFPRWARIVLQGGSSGGWKLLLQFQPDLEPENHVREPRIYEQPNHKLRTAKSFWWRCPGLNGGPAAYESAALPTELHRHDAFVCLCKSL